MKSINIVLTLINSILNNDARKLRPVDIISFFPMKEMKLEQKHSLI